MKKDDIKLRLRDLLKEIFQFDSEDLDFGIYKIMNYKRKEIEHFINKVLIDNIKDQLKLLGEEERAKIRDDIEKLKAQIKDSFGEDAFKDGDLKNQFENTPLGKKYLAKLAQLKSIKVSEELESKIYNHIYSFFSRYYDKGDFISKRRYGRKDKYAVPYSGEEVFLFWANKDQYYVKTTKYFKRYTFKVKDITVNFRVVEAEEEKGDVKAQENKFFVLSKNVFDLKGKELDIYFEYRALTEDEKKRFGEKTIQDNINAQIFDILKKKFEKESKTVCLFDKEGEKTILERHIFKYTRRNTSDYFIHKHLKDFLEGELDFYIKNEVLNLEDLRRLDKEKVAPYLLEAQVIRNISSKIIEFLSQIEDFQKKIWEKKKFVIKTEYVITLDKIMEYGSEKLLETIIGEILENNGQLKEWKELFGIEAKEKKDLMNGKNWKRLPIDTKYFSEEFKWKLVTALSANHDLNEMINGVLVKSENWQALHSVINKYKDKVKCIYIDPPFNTGTNEFLYKNNYLDSSWISMIVDRLRLGKKILADDGSIYIRIDFHGNHYVRALMNLVFGNDKFKNDIAIKRGRETAGSRGKLEQESENIFYYTKSGRFILNDVETERPVSNIQWTSFLMGGERKPRERIFLGKTIIPPDGQHYPLNQEKVDLLLKDFFIRLRCRSCGAKYYFGDSDQSFQKKMRDKRNRYKFYDIKAEDTVIGVNKLDNCLECGVDNFSVDYLGAPTRRVNSVWLDIESYAKTWGFFTENSEPLLQRIVIASSNKGDWISDYFLGSGTTIAVSHKLGRKWIGVEMGEHFDTVIIPRMKEVLAGFGKHEPCGISKEINWKGGGFFAYQVLEQYEDALENIEFEQKTLEEFKDYFVKYMLDFETKKSSTFLNIDKLENPFKYKLKFIENYEHKIADVDLVETFNYLLGLSVNRYIVFENNKRKYVIVIGNTNGKKAMIVWRSTKEIDFKKDKEVIEKIRKDFNPDETFVNGDCAVKGFKQIESEFKSLMW